MDSASEDHNTKYSRLHDESDITYGSTDQVQLPGASESFQVQPITIPHNVTSDQNRTSFYVYMLSLFAGLGGFLFGYDTGVVSGVLLLLKCNFKLTSFQQELFVGITIGFAAVTSIIAGIFNDAFGRKVVILFSSVIFIGSALILAFAKSFGILLLGRAVAGIGIGLASMTIPMYIAECSHSSVRGRLVVIFQLCITFGQFVAALIDGFFSFDKTNGWRFMLGLAVIPGLIQFIGVAFMPESPRWLVSQGQIRKAEEVLKKIRQQDDVNKELKSIEDSCEEFISSASGTGSYPTFIRVFTVSHVAKAIFIGCMLQIFQQLSGINTVMYYSASIIQMSGVRSNTVAIWLAAIVAGTNFVFSLVGICLVERVGRRRLLLFSSFGVTMSLAFIALSFQLASLNSPNITIEEVTNTTADLYNCYLYKSCSSCHGSGHCGYCFEYSGSIPTNASCVYTAGQGAAYGRCASEHTDTCDENIATGSSVWSTDYCPSTLAWLATLGLLLYLMCFAPGLGPMPWTINSEIYPQWARATGNSLATTMNWTFNLLVSLTFLTLTDTSPYGTFCLYAALAFVGFIFFLMFVPETKGRTLEEMETLLKQPWFSRAYM